MKFHLTILLFFLLFLITFVHSDPSKWDVTVSKTGKRKLHSELADDIPDDATEAIEEQEQEEIEYHEFLGFLSNEEELPPEKHFFLSNVTVFTISYRGNSTDNAVLRNETFNLWVYSDSFFVDGEVPEGRHFVQVGSELLQKRFDELSFENEIPDGVWIAALVWIFFFICCVGCSCALLCCRKGRTHYLKKEALRDNDYDEAAALQHIRTIQAQEREKWSSLGAIFYLFYLLGGHRTLSEQRKESKADRHLRGRFDNNWMLRNFYAIRHYVGELIESAPVQTVLLLLLVVDVLLLVVELTLEVFYPNEQGVTHHPPGWVEVVETVIIVLTLMILVIFEIELLSLIFSFGLLFFTNPLYVIDLIVVTTALLIEVVFRSYVVSALSGFLTIMRLWRIARIVQAVFLASENRHNRTKEYVRQLEEELFHMRERHREISKQRVTENINGGLPSSLEAFA